MSKVKEANTAIDKSAIDTVLRLMALAARTAPKSFAMDCLEMRLAGDDDRMRIAATMRTVGEKKSSSMPSENKARSLILDWTSDAEAIEKADGMLLIGIFGDRPPGVNCGGCGFPTCAEMLKAPRMTGKDFPGPFCMYRIIDLGIAVSSAVSVAAHHFLDNRMFQKAGLSAMQLGLMKSAPVLGVAVSCSAKNIFFDRKDKAIAMSLARTE